MPPSSPPSPLTDHAAAVIKIFHQLALRSSASSSSADSSRPALLYSETILRLQQTARQFADPAARATAERIVVCHRIAEHLDAIAARLQSARDVLAATPQHFDGYLGEPYISNEQFAVVAAALDDIAPHHAAVHGIAAARLSPERQTALVQRLNLGAFHAATDTLLGDIYRAALQTVADLLSRLDTARAIAQNARETALF